jgi:exopolysaccharide biosynthesis protein
VKNGWFGNICCLGVGSIFYLHPKVKKIFQKRTSNTTQSEKIICRVLTINADVAVRCDRKKELLQGRFTRFGAAFSRG